MKTTQTTAAQYLLINSDAHGNMARFQTLASGEVEVYGFLDTAEGAELQMVLPAAAARAVWSSLLAAGYTWHHSRLDAAPMGAPPAAAIKPQLGDTVRGTYHGVPFVGTFHSIDGSGCVYVRFTAEQTIIVLDIPRDGICLHHSSEEIAALEVMSRPAVAPTVRHAADACMGGAYVA